MFVYEATLADTMNALNGPDVNYSMYWSRLNYST